MDKKAITSMKKLVRNGRDLAEIITKYLSVLEAAIATESPEAPAKKPGTAKKAVKNAVAKK
ncbi:MAG TPA: hypothetical protein DCQ16_09620, partial [Spirochaetaceae bacterium]|nr:hypothetical protein [Spirochaetaceae bacterium]